MFYKEIVETLSNVLSRYKGVNFVRYCGEDLINQQNNHKNLQCWIDNVSLTEINITTNVNKMSFEIYILGFPDGTSGNTSLDIQDVCYTLAVNFVSYLDFQPQYNRILSLYDYSILTIDRFTDNSNAGVKLSLVLEVPNPLNLCSYEENFNDEPYPEDPDIPEIDIPIKEVGELDIKPIHLPKNRQC